MMLLVDDAVAGLAAVGDRSSNNPAKFVRLVEVTTTFNNVQIVTEDSTEASYDLGGKL
jgi:hypothetical protein